MTAPRAPLRLLVLAGGLFLCAQHSAAAPKPNAVHGVSVFRAGFPARTARISPGHPASWNYRLLEGATQGGPVWYVLRLHVEVAVRHQTRSLAYLSASTNGWTAAQIEMKAVRIGGRLVTSTSSLGLVDGLIKQSTRKKVFRLRFANYLQRRGVRGGRNRLTVRVDLPRAPRVVTVRVLPDTEIIRTATPPPSLSLHVSWPSRESPRVGKPFTIHWGLSNRSALAAFDVNVQPVFNGRDFETVGRRRSIFERFEGTRQGTFTLLPLRSVRTTLFVRAQSPNANSPAAAIAAVVLPRQTSAPTGPSRIVGMLLFAGGIVVLAFLRRSQA